MFVERRTRRLSMADIAVLPPVPTSVPSDPVRADAPGSAPVRPRFRRLVVFTGKLS
jgi:hypothetical protein